MKNFISVICLSFAVLASVVSADLLCAGSPEGFSAEMVSSFESEMSRGKIYVSKEKTRLELPEAIVITRLDKNLSWMIIPSQKMYMEQPLDPKVLGATQEKFPGEVSRTLIGSESVEGLMSQKYQIEYRAKNENVTVFQWITNDTSIPIKTEAADGSWSMIYRKLSVGPQSDELFELPAGYTQMPVGMPSMGFSEDDNSDEGEI